MKTISLFIFSLILFQSHAQTLEPLSVCTQSIAIPGALTVSSWQSEHKNEAYPNYPKMFYGFAEGDEILIDFTMDNKKGSNGMEIKDMETNSVIYSNSGFQNLEGLRISCPKTAIYKIQFSTSHMFDRNCHLSIKRIPASEATKKFNTMVYWKTINDTTFTTEEEKYLVKTDTSIINLIEQNAKIHSQTNANGNTSNIPFDIPANTVAWSYYIGVDQQGNQAFQDATAALASKAAPAVAKIPGYGPLAALALGSISYLNKIQAGEDIDYSLYDANNQRLRGGLVKNDFSQMVAPLSGKYQIHLFNDNAVTPVDVLVKVTAITVNQTWATRPVQKPHITSRQEAYLKN